MPSFRIVEILWIKCVHKVVNRMYIVASCLLTLIMAAGGLFAFLPLLPARLFSYAVARMKYADYS